MKKSIYLALIAGMALSLSALPVYAEEPYYWTDTDGSIYYWEDGVDTYVGQSGGGSTSGSSSDDSQTEQTTDASSSSETTEAATAAQTSSGETTTAATTESQEKDTDTTTAGTSSDPALKADQTPMLITKLGDDIEYTQYEGASTVSDLVEGLNDLMDLNYDIKIAVSENGTIIKWQKDSSLFQTTELLNQENSPFENTFDAEYYMMDSLLYTLRYNLGVTNVYYANEDGTQLSVKAITLPTNTPYAGSAYYLSYPKVYGTVDNEKAAKIISILLDKKMTVGSKLTCKGEEQTKNNETVYCYEFSDENGSVVYAVSQKGVIYTEDDKGDLVIADTLVYKTITEGAENDSDSSDSSASSDNSSSSSSGTSATTADADTSDRSDGSASSESTDTSSNEDSASDEDTPSNEDASSDEDASGEDAPSNEDASLDEDASLSEE